jgi:hypothetical protein
MIGAGTMRTLSQSAAKSWGRICGCGIIDRWPISIVRHIVEIVPSGAMPTQGLKPAPFIFRVSSAASETLVRSSVIANVNPAARFIALRREIIDRDSTSRDALDQLPGPPFEQPSGPLEMEILN